MGARTEQRKSEALGQAALLEIQQAEQRRINAEQQLAIGQNLLGTPQQLAGQLGGAGFDPNVAPFTGRFVLDQGALSNITDLGRGNTTQQVNDALANANNLLAQAEQLARSGDLAGAQALKQQAQSGLLNGVKFNVGGVQPAFQSLFSLQENPQQQAFALLNSPLGQLVGQQVNQGRQFADPNSAASRQLFDQIVTQPAATIEAGLQSALRAIGSRTSAALGEVTRGFTDALASVSGGTAQALQFINEGFGRAISALEVGRATSLAEIETGLQAGIQAVKSQTENALRSIEAGTRETRRGAIDQMRQRGAAARPLAMQAVQNRATERFDTSRAQAETESGRLQALLQAGASSEKAGIMERTGQGLGQLEAQGALARANVQQQSTQLTAGLQSQQAQLKAQLEQQAGLLEAQLNVQANIAKGDLMQRGAMFTEQFRADFAFTSVQAAQAFLSNQAGVREQFQGALDNLSVASAQILQQQSSLANQRSLQFQAQAAQADSERRQLLGQVIGAVAGIGAAIATSGASSGLSAVSAGGGGAAAAGSIGQIGNVNFPSGTFLGAASGGNLGSLFGGATSTLSSIGTGGATGALAQGAVGRSFGSALGSAALAAGGLIAPGTIDPRTGRPRTTPGPVLN